MRPLLEYLISKENKSRIRTKYTKQDLKTGDIVKNKLGTYLYVILTKDIKSELKNAKFLRNFQYVYAYKADFFIYSINEGPAVFGLNMYSDDLEYNSHVYDRFSIESVYPGERIQIIEADDITSETLQQIAEKRNRIDLK